jgi:hypothetical protein
VAAAAERKQKAFCDARCVSGNSDQISPSPPNKNRNSDTKELRFLFLCGIIVPDNVIGDEKTCLTLRTKNQKFVS